MVAGAVAQIIRAPGKIIICPDDLTAADPYGGIEIGLANQVTLQSHGTPFRVRSEALGETVDVLEPDKDYRFSCFLRGWDDDAVEQTLREGYYAGAASQHAVFAEPGATPGASALDRALLVLFVPDDKIHVNSLLLYRAVPDWSEGAELAFQRGAEFGIPITMDCLRDSRNNILTLGRFSDLSLI
jgi:hypothetical protein